VPHGYGPDSAGDHAVVAVDLDVMQLEALLATAILHSDDDAGIALGDNQMTRQATVRRFGRLRSGLRHSGELRDRGDYCRYGRRAVTAAGRDSPAGDASGLYSLELVKADDLLRAGKLGAAV
jgi:hypothetical protein